MQKDHLTLAETRSTWVKVIRVSWPAARLPQPPDLPELPLVWHESSTLGDATLENQREFWKHLTDKSRIAKPEIFSIGTLACRAVQEKAFDEHSLMENDDKTTIED